jgi:hypothetical protein
MEAWELKRIEALKMLHEPTVDHVTVHDYDFLVRRGLLVLTYDEKKAMFQRRFDFVVMDLFRDMEDSKAFRCKGLIAEIEKARLGEYTEGFRAKMVRAGKRLAVLDWIEKERTNQLVHQ